MTKAVKKTVKKKTGTSKLLEGIKTEGSTKEQKIEQPKDYILKNLQGEEMDPKDYFFTQEGKEVVVPTFFNRVVGRPVDREDLIEEFNKAFKPSDNFLFYKKRTSEIYLVIVPLKFSSLTADNDSKPNDYQVHSMSFINEGSVQPAMLKSKLALIVKNLGYGK